MLFIYIYVSFLLTTDGIKTRTQSLKVEHAKKIRNQTTANEANKKGEEKLYTNLVV